MENRSPSDQEALPADAWVSGKWTQMLQGQHFLSVEQAWRFAFHLSRLTEGLGHFSGENSTVYQTSLTGFRSLPLTYTMTGMNPRGQGR